MGRLDPEQGEPRLQPLPVPPVTTPLGVGVPGVPPPCAHLSTLPRGGSPPGEGDPQEAGACVASEVRAANPNTIAGHWLDHRMLHPAHASPPPASRGATHLLPGCFLAICPGPSQPLQVCACSSRLAPTSGDCLGDETESRVGKCFVNCKVQYAGK